MTSTSSPVRSRASASPRRRTWDATFFLTLLLLPLFLVNSQQIIAPLGGAGSPALLMGLAALAWWLFAQLARSHRTGGGRRQLVRWGVLGLATVFLASYATAMARAIDADEVSGATLGLVLLASLMGILLLALDGITTMARWQVLLDRLLLAITLLGLLGLAQFLTGSTLIGRLQFPGLTQNSAVAAVDLLSRNGFTRPAGTATHPLEYGATLTMALPLLIARARFATRPGGNWWWLAVMALGLGIVVSISRSALVCTGVGLLVLGVTWPPRVRRLAAVGVVALMGVVAVGIPGMLGTLRGLFVTASADGSIESRTGSYDIALQFFSHSPLLGRGFSTFTPKYRIFDNQWLLLLVEVGAAGVLAFLALLLSAMWSAWQVRRMSTDPEMRELAQAFVAGIAAASTSFALYDGFSFPLALMVLFLLLGMAGALLRLVREGPEQSRQPGRSDPVVA